MRKRISKTLFISFITVSLFTVGVVRVLEFEVGPDNKVVLRGQVVRPTTKSDAGLPLLRA